MLYRHFPKRLCPANKKFPNHNVIVAVTENKLSAHCIKSIIWTNIIEKLRLRHMISYSCNWYSFPLNVETRMYQSLPQSRICAANSQRLQDDRLQEFYKKMMKKRKCNRSSLIQQYKTQAYLWSQTSLQVTTPLICLY